MTSPAGKVRVVVEGDTSKLGAQLQADIAKAMSGVHLNLTGVSNQLRDALTKAIDGGAKALGHIDDDAKVTFSKLTDSAKTAGSKVGDEIDKGATTAKRSLTETGDKGKTELAKIETAGTSAGTHLGSVFTKVAGVITAAFATMAVGRLLKESAVAADDLGASMRRTAQIITTTGGAAGLLAADVREMAKGLSVKIGVDSLEVQDAINVLLTFRSVSGPVLKQAIGLAADLSTVFGQDLKGSAVQLGKALQDPVAGIAALHRVGVDFSDVQKKQIQGFIDTNQLAKAQAVILEEVTREVGGVAAASADAGDKLKVFGADLKRALGASLADLIDQVGPQLFAVADILAPALGVIGKGVADLLGGLLPAIGPLITAFSESISIVADSLAPLGAAFGQVFVALIPLLVPLAQIISVLVASGLAPVLVALTPAIVAIVGPLSQILTLVAAGLTPALTGLLSGLTPVIALFAQLVGWLTGSSKPAEALRFALIGIAAALAIYETVTTAVSVATKVWTAAQVLLDVALDANPIGLIIVAIGALIGAIIWVATKTTWFQATWEAVWSFLKTVGAWFAGPFAGFFVRAWQSVLDFFAGIGSAISNAWAAVLGFFLGIGHWFAALPGQIGAFLASLPGKLVDAIVAMFDAGLKALGFGIGVLLAGIILLPRILITGLVALPGVLGDFFAGLWHHIADLAVAGWDAFISFAIGIGSRLLAALTALPGLIVSFFASLWSTVAGLAEAGFHAVVGFAIALPGQLWAALSALPALIGGAITAALAFARDAAINGFNAIIDFVKSVPAKIGALAGLMASAGLSLIRGLMSGLGQAGGFVGDLASKITGAIKGFLNSVIGKINSGIASVDDALPGISLPRIPSLATGGLTTSAVLANLHPQELILPLESPRSTDLLARALAEAQAGLRATGVPGADAQPQFDVRVYIGDRELTDIVDVQISDRNRALAARVQAGAGRR